jgi:hypothetical protein
VKVVTEQQGEGDSMGERKIVFRGMEAIVFEKIPETFPLGYRFYGIRHKDDDFDEPATLEPFVGVNRWGVIGFKEPIIPHMINEDCIFLSRGERDLVRGRP